MVFLFYSVDVVYHVYWLTYIEPSLGILSILQILNPSLGRIPLDYVNFHIWYLHFHVACSVICMSMCLSWEHKSRGQRTTLSVGTHFLPCIRQDLWFTTVHYRLAEPWATEESPIAAYRLTARSYKMTNMHYFIRQSIASMLTLAQ